MSYGEVAEMAGYPGRARGVGTVLRDSEGLPWWRVVAADGRLRAPDTALQTARLEAEGLTIIDGRVRLPRRSSGP